MKYYLIISILYFSITGIAQELKPNDQIKKEINAISVKMESIFGDMQHIKKTNNYSRSLIISKNPAIKKIRAQITELQEKLDNLILEDKEYQKSLKEEKALYQKYYTLDKKKEDLKKKYMDYLKKNYFQAKKKEVDERQKAIEKAINNK